MATWAKGIDFKNSANTARVGGLGIYGTDTKSEKIYLGLGSEPWNNSGLELTSSAISFKGNKVYHAGSKPTPAEIGAASSSHTHNYAGSSSAGGAATTALTSNYLGSNSRMEYGWNGVNYFNINGTAGNAAKANDTPSTAWWHIMRFNHANGTGYYTDLAVPFNDTSLHYKRITAGSVQNGGWVKVLDSLNYNSYAPTKTGTGASGTWSISITGNANTTTTLQTARTINGTSFNGSANITTANWGTARTITIGSTGKSVNGSANVSWSLAEIGAAAASHTHSYLPLSGGTMTGKITTSANTGTYLAGNQGGALINSTSSAGTYTMLYRYPSTNGYFTTGGYQGNYLLQYTAKTTVDAGTNGVTKSVTLLNESGNSSFPGTVSAPTFSGTLSGNASTATTLQTARTINGTSFNGSANITTANWGTARTITIGSTGKSVNGSANISWSLAEIGAAASSHNHDGVYMKQVSANGYWGMTANGDTSNWVRTTSNGIIPYQSGGASSLGTSSWPFNNIYANNIYDNGTLLENKFAAASHSHSYLPLSGGTMSGDIQMNGKVIKLTTSYSGYPKIGYDASSTDTYIGNIDNNWLRLKKDLVLTYGGHWVHHDGWCGSIKKDLPRVTNLNTLYISGWYSWSGSGTGTPTAYGVVLNLMWGTAGSSTADRYQYAMGSNNVFYVRSYINGAWNSWKVW